MTKLIFINRISISIIGFFALGCALLVSFLLFGPKLKSYTRRTSFESSEWKAHLKDQSTAKLNMVDDLLSKRQLIGMKMNDIDELLGAPPKTGYFKEYDYVYWLGPERKAMGIDSEWLGLKFQDGVVIKADILSD